MNPDSDSAKRRARRKILVDMLPSFSFRRPLVSLGLGAILAGCAVPQASSPPAPLGAMAQVSTHLPQARSWMGPTARGRDLLYVSTANDVYVYTYPQGQLVGTLTGFFSPLGECVDSSGDVFIVTLANESGSSSIIYEYAHGGTQPIATLDDPAGAGGCAIDPRSGNLAVADWPDSSNPYGDYGAVAVYAGARGSPTMYYSSEFFAFELCGYDSKGNLYLSATNGYYGDQAQLVRLAARSSTFEQISLNAKLYTQGMSSSVQWDGEYMTVSSSLYKTPTYLYRLRISGESATVVGTVTLNSRKNTLKSGQIWIQGKRVLEADYLKGAGGINSWSYPGAEKPRAIVPNESYLAPDGLAVSPADILATGAPIRHRDRLFEGKAQRASFQASHFAIAF